MLCRGLLGLSSLGWLWRGCRRLLGSLGLCRGWLRRGSLGWLWFWLLRLLLLGRGLLLLSLDKRISKKRRRQTHSPLQVYEPPGFGPVQRAQGLADSQRQAYYLINVGHIVRSCPFAKQLDGDPQ